MLYRFQLELSDIDRGLYKTLDFRISQHPSETQTYLLSRVLAYALSYQDNLEFTPGGLSDPDAPALRALGSNNSVDLWIEIGNPSARRLHKATKTAKQVIVYTYKSADVLIQDIKANDVHRANEIQIYSFSSQLLQDLEKQIEKNNRWTVLQQQGQLDIDTGKASIAGEVKKASF